MTAKRKYVKMKIVLASDAGLDRQPAKHFAYCSHFIVLEKQRGETKSTETVEIPYSAHYIVEKIPKFVKYLEADVTIPEETGPSAVAFFDDRRYPGSS